ncbi:hypothetical protein [Calycomorphotria hydatis]|uniref:HEAT repeat domain-containing protein n=1 Tax=Calycomorphotria hydatis TaxID=2528027 RepID=A0A517TAE0_9PLAN|nr:hypothetical protein [Calycomorphotria hydatis]QDT65340.1 hypothetical protein V22_25890 [Calycomorphotria hydatis]
MKLARLPFLLFAIAITSIGLSTQAQACPFCEAPSLTLTEQLDQSDVVLLGEWISATAPESDGTVAAKTIYRIRKVIKGDFEEQQLLQLSGYQPGEQGELALLTGVKAEVIEWDLPTEITEAAFEYVSGAPSPNKPTVERLPYFVKYLENEDDLIASDSYGEFANAPFEDIEKVKKLLPTEKVAQWVINPDTSPARLGLYGLLLGLCGDKDNLVLMKKMIMEPVEDIRIGINGIMSGYVYLGGAEALDLLVDYKLKSEYLIDDNGNVLKDEDGNPIPVPFSETYAAMQSISFMWTYGQDRISKEKLRAALRTLLDRPELADFAIRDLARWKDWSIQKRLYELYGEDGYTVPGTKRAIVKYFLASTKDLPDGVTDENKEKLPEHAKLGQMYLDKLKERDPQTVEDVMSFQLLLD